MHPFILFEGLDRTGKTIVAKRIANVLNARYLHSPPEPLVPYRKEFDNLDNIANFQFYLVGNIILNTQVRLALLESPVVLDRHFPSTIAYHAPILNLDLDYHMNYMDPFPNHIFYFTADLNVLEQRSKNSGKTNDRFHGIDYWRQVRKNYERIFEGDSRVHKIDTTNLCVDGVFNKVMENL